MVCGDSARRRRPRSFSIVIVTIIITTTRAAVAAGAGTGIGGTTADLSAQGRHHTTQHLYCVGHYSRAETFHLACFRRSLRAHPCSRNTNTITTVTIAVTAVMAIIISVAAGAVIAAAHVAPQG